MNRPAPRVRKTSTCHACGLEGHISSNKICQFYGQRRQIGGQPVANVRMPNLRSSNQNDENIDDNDGEDNADLDDDIVEDAIDLNEDAGLRNRNYEWEECELTDAELRESRSGVHEIGKLPRFLRENSVGITDYGRSLLRTKDELDFFTLFFDEEVMSNFVSATNWYGQTYITDWEHDVDISEFRHFFAMILTQGMIKYPNRKMAFDDQTFGCRFLTDTMSKKRFDQLLKAWHFENLGRMSTEEVQNFKKNNPFWAVKRLASSLSLKYMSCYQCGQRLDIDEQCVPWKGRHKCRCYNPKKPEKWHFKIFGLNDSATGYQTNFYLYEGKAEQRPPDTPATLYPIKKLLEDQRYHNVNHLIATDNWYTSVPAAEFIKSEVHADYIGTIKTNKSHLPAEGKFAKTGGGRKRRGDMKQMVAKMFDSPASDMYFIAWMDNNPVHLLSTIKSHRAEVTRNVENASGKWTKQIFSQPSMVREYNHTMGGTDLGDQLLSYYRSRLRSFSWIPRLLTHFLHTSVINAYILFKSTVIRPKDPTGRYSLIDFLRPLIIALSREYAGNRVESTCISVKASTRPLNMKRKASLNRDISRQFCNGVPVITFAKSEKDRKRDRGHCIICTNNTPVRCTSCQKYLCIYSDGINKTCWEKYHFDDDILAKTNKKKK